jgi:osmotically-inducible protein OsmY
MLGAGEEDLMDRQLEERVREALERNPRVSNPTDVAILAEDETVTLRGTLPTIRERRAAVEATGRLRGVRRVVDHLSVKWFGDVRSDDELRGLALQALTRDEELPPAGGIDVKVASGWVTLTGQVQHQSQSDAAFEDVASLEGVGGITNKIRVVTGAS